MLPESKEKKPPEVRLCELMEPEPPDTYMGAAGLLSPGEWWVADEEGLWDPRAITHDQMARVREELKRRGLDDVFARKVLATLKPLKYLPQGTGTYLDVFAFIDAPLSVQIAAAIEVMKKGEKR